MIKKYQYLDKVNFPSDIKSLKSSELKLGSDNDTGVVILPPQSEPETE